LLKLYLRTLKNYSGIMKNNFYIKTYGCSSNFADSNFIVELLLKNNYKESAINTAEFVLINSCTVKGPTASKIKDFISKIKQNKQNIIILGCLPSDKKFVSEFKEYSMISPYNIDLILDAFEKITLSKKPIKLLTPKILDKTLFSYNTKNIAIVQPLIGCLGNCTFCKTKLAKPLFYSYPLENIIKRIDDYIGKGVKEIWISSEDNGAYGKDLKINYMDLLMAIEKRFKGKAMFRLGMANPWLIDKHLDELINFFKTTKTFYKFLHIPIQSASNNVLKNMKRPYTEKKLHHLFSKLRTNFSKNKLTLATDTIVGFPYETEADFNKTLEFVTLYDFLINNVSQFWPMSFTAAAKMKQLPTELKKERSRILSKLYSANYVSILDSYVGKKIDVYFNDVDSNGNYLGRTKNYISVILHNPKKTVKLGLWAKFIVKKRENSHLLV